MPIYTTLFHVWGLSFANLNFIPKYDVCQVCIVEIGRLFRIMFLIVKLNIFFSNSPSKMALPFDSVHRNFKSAALYVFCK